MIKDDYSFGIIIIGYKNKNGIKRLLDSISKVNYLGDKNIKLIISIDFSGDYSVKKVAEDFYWEYGEKIIIEYDKNLGLKNHILKCGDYLNKYNLLAAAVLEDDIYVAPSMYGYMKATVEYYKDDSRIAGISFYKHELDVLAKKRFDDLADDGDVYFIQYAASWGQVWIRDKWNDFKKWYLEEQWIKMDKKKIPKNILMWENSWLKYHIMYCIDKNLYFVYPRISQTTNFSDVGVHRNKTTTAMQVKLSIEKKIKWNLKTLDESLAIYDAYFENECLRKYLQINDLIINLNGVKRDISSSRFLLSSNILPYACIKSWGLSFRPIEMNIFLNNPGKDLFLYDTTKKVNKIYNKKHNLREYEYELKGINIIKKETFIFIFNSIINNIYYRLKK